MRDAVTHSHRLCITLHYLANDDNSESLKIVRITSQSTGIIVLEMCLLLGWQTMAE